MDTGKHRDNYTFYEGYEGEREIILSLSDVSYHIWDGYFEDIFGNPIVEEDGWNGFTRDYNEFVNTFDDECVECAIMPEEYLRDIKLYVGQTFSYKETQEMLDLLQGILTEAIESQECLFVRIN